MGWFFLFYVMLRKSNIYIGFLVPNKQAVMLDFGNIVLFEIKILWLNKILFTAVSHIFFLFWNDLYRPRLIDAVCLSAIYFLSHFVLVLKSCFCQQLFLWKFCFLSATFVAFCQVCFLSENLAFVQNFNFLTVDILTSCSSVAS